MKKALIIANLAGFASFLISDMELLKKMGYEIIFAANGRKLQWDTTRERLDSREIPFIQIDFDSKKVFSKDNIMAYRQVKTLIENENFDIVHCHTPIVGLIVRLAGRKYRKKGLKILYTTHGFTFTAYSPKKQWLVYYNIEKFLSGYTDAIITINNEDYAYAKTMRCKKVFHINGVGVDIAKYRDINIDIKQYREKIGVPCDKIMVLSVGELSERKNYQAIIRALGVLDVEKYCYVICGSGIDGGNGNKLKELAEAFNVDLKLLGFRNDIPEIMHCSDIGAIPSTREGLGLAGIQSLAAGVPLVGTGVQGIKEYITDGQTGYLCDACDYQAYATAIEKLSNVIFRNDMRKNCIAVSEKFDISISKKQREEIYRKMLIK